MEIVDRSGMAFGMIGGRAFFPGHSLTLVVKGTFDLAPGEAARLADEQLFPTGDEPFEDGDEEAASLRYPSDFAHYKPRADLHLVGSARVPRGGSATRLPVGFRVGDTAKALLVFGDRWWTTGVVRSEATDPHPFTEMPLRYENAFGGEGFAYNPAGKGYTEIESEAGYKVLPLPNVEYPGAAVDTPEALPFPAGFGPMAREWRPRIEKAGTYDAAWLEERWPWFPADLDWSFFNAAPPDLQVDGFLRGDEEVRLENLDRELPHFTSRLPGIRARCFLHEGEEGEEAPPDTVSAFREVPMNLDTLWIDADARKLVLVWRGVADVGSEEMEDIRHVLVLSEPLDGEPRSLAACRTELEEVLAAEAAEEEAIDPASLLPPREPEDPELDQEADAALEKLNQDLAAAGIAPVELPAEPPEAPSPDEDFPGPLARADVEARREAGEALVGQDMTGADLSAMDLGGLDLTGTVLTGASLRGTRLDAAELGTANLSDADLAGASLREAGLADADLTGADLEGADLTGADLEGATLEGANLREACLEGARAPDAILAGADLTRVRAAGGAFVGADFEGATLREADFRGADLSEACLEGAVAVGADFSTATLRELQAGEGADFTRASFREAVAPEAIWTDSTLVEADLTFCAAEGADLTAADLERAVLTGADLTSGRLIRARLNGARMIQCNLFEASLEKAVLEDADVRDANLYGAEVLDARLDGADLRGANVKMTKLDRR